MGGALRRTPSKAKNSLQKKSKNTSKNMAKNSYKIDVMETVTASMVRRLQEGGFILLGALAIFLFLALFTYHETDPGWSHVGTYDTLHNAAGKTGAWVSDYFYSYSATSPIYFP